MWYNTLLCTTFIEEDGSLSFLRCGSSEATFDATRDGGSKKKEEARDCSEHGSKSSICSKREVEVFHYQFPIGLEYEVSESSDSDDSSNDDMGSLESTLQTQQDLPGKFEMKTNPLMHEPQSSHQENDFSPIETTTSDLTAEDVAAIWAQIYKQQQSILTESKVRRKSYEIGDKGGDEGNIEKLKARKRELEKSFSFSMIQAI